MISDKEIALELIDVIEEMHLREIVYEAVLNAVTEHDWKGTLAKALADESDRKKVHEKFQPLRESVLDAPDLTSVVRRMLDELDQGRPTE
jgi:hypothetical protein